jgi:hypothetical protein
MRQSDYEIILVDDDGGIIYLADRDMGNVSVTNDAENVAKAIHAQYPYCRIIYKDSMGNWDEILHAGGIFKGFKQARGPSL